MNYEPGQKVIVNVNGAEWEDEISCSGVKHKEEVLTYCLSSGIEAPCQNISSVEPEIKPKPGDIVYLYDDIEGHGTIRIFVKNVPGKNGGFIGENSFLYKHCDVLARKPKRWDDVERDKQLEIYKDCYALWSSSIWYANDPNAFQNLIDKIISAVLGGVPYARIGE